MRIIAGEFRGRTVKFPKSKLVRPTTDKVKESLFNYLANIIDFDGIKVCDIYAGSGSLGLEAKSRGAAEVHFVEKNYGVSKILEENIRSLQVEDKCRIFRIDSVKFSALANFDKYDLILADPPFFKNEIYLASKKILERDFLNTGGIFIIERSVQTEKDDVENFGCSPFKRIGDSLIYKFEK